VITGHLGIAGAAHASRRDSSLPWLLVAAMAPDIVDALFVVVRQCNPHGLYSHTVPAAALLAVVFGAVAYYFTDQRATGVLCMLLVLAHLPADFITGHKLFWPGAEFMGLRLYDRHPIGDFVLESSIVVFGWWLLRSRPWAPRWASRRATLVGLLVIQIVVEAAGTARGGVKPSACAAPEIDGLRRSGPGGAVGAS
jgi:membrane-bound metal-dependent hydrolase YbcI (DUF457 family)